MGQEHIDEEQPEAPLSDDVLEGPPPRKWLYDRIQGTSKYGDAHPPMQCCWVPPPVGWCPAMMEENACCRLWGRVGLIDADNETARYWLLHIGFAANVIGCILTMYACLAATTEYDLLSAAAFSSGTVTEVGGQANVSGTIELGMKAAAVDLPTLDGPTVLNFDSFCDLPSESLERYMSQGDEDCGKCEEVSQGMVISTIMSVITFLPSFFTDILRMYSNYDVNCQRSFSTIVAIVAIILSLNTLLKYNNTCFDAFYEGDVPFDENQEAIEDDSVEPTYVLNFDWSIGPGLICLYTGTLLKIVDVVVNALIPTPNITRDTKEKSEYEQIEERLEEQESASEVAKAEREETAREETGREEE